MRMMNNFMLLLVLVAACIPPGSAWAQNNLQTEIAIKNLQDDGSPAKWRTIFDDFNYLNTAQWDTTSYGGGSAGTVSIPDSVNVNTSFYIGKQVTLATTAAANSMVRLRGAGNGVQLYEGKYTEFEARIALNTDSTNVGFAAGLVSTSANEDSITARGRFPTDGLIFLKRAGTARIMTSKAYTGVSADSALTTKYIPRMTWRTLKITYGGPSGNVIRFYIDGALVKAYTATTKPLVTLRPFFEVRCKTAGIQKMFVDYVLVRQRR